MPGLTVGALAKRTGLTSRHARTRMAVAARRVHQRPLRHRTQRRPHDASRTVRAAAHEGHGAHSAGDGRRRGGDGLLVETDQLAIPKDARLGVGNWALGVDGYLVPVSAGFDLIVFTICA